MIEQKVPVEEKNGTVYYSVKKMWYDGNGNVVKEKILTNSAGESDSYSEVKYTYDNRNNLVVTESNDGEESNYTQYYYDGDKGTVLPSTVLQVRYCQERMEIQLSAIHTTTRVSL